MDTDQEKVFIPEIIEAGSQGERLEEARADKARIGCAVSGGSYLVMIVLGIVIYIWTIGIAYQYTGLLGAMLSLMFPGFSQVFWGVYLWIETKTLMNPYCLTLLGYVFAAVFVRAGIFLFQNSILRSRTR